jgi:hypothetical protein
MTDHSDATPLDAASIADIRRLDLDALADARVTERRVASV